MGTCEVTCKYSSLYQFVATPYGKFPRGYVDVVHCRAPRGIVLNYMHTLACECDKLPLTRDQVVNLCEESLKQALNFN